jgi:beta-lactamase class A
MTLLRRGIRLWLRVTCAVLVASLAFAAPLGSQASMIGPFSDLQMRISRAAFSGPGTIGIAVEDLATGMTSGFNERASLPAASTIKIPVMVEVFRQMANGRIDLDKRVHLNAGDRDWGSGDLAGARVGTTRSVEQLLWLMINDSDNTATNMLIRLVGRQRINKTMSELGLPSTRLGDYIRSSGTQIRYALRSSPHDMVRLLDKIARKRLVDEWSSREMLAILTGQTHNSLLPQPLPKELKIAHKTGSLHDTLNDVGIVYLEQEPYVIAVMTTRLPSLSVGRRFIHKVSRIAFDELGRFEKWRSGSGLPAFDLGLATSPKANLQPLAPDLEMWNVKSPLPNAVEPDSTPSLWEPPPATP